MNGPTMRRFENGRIRPTSKPPMSRRRSSMISSIIDSVTPLDAMPLRLENGAASVRDRFRLVPHSGQLGSVFGYQSVVGVFNGTAQLALASVTGIDHQQDFALDQSDALGGRQQSTVLLQCKGKVLIQRLPPDRGAQHQ